MNGIRVAQPAHRVTDSKYIAFSSEHDYMKLDVRHSPKLFDFQTYTFTTAPANPGVGQTIITDMLTVNHALGYIPVVLVYFYSYNFTGAYTLPTSYQLGQVGIESGFFATQTLSYYADQNQLKVYHSVTHNSSNPSDVPFFSMAGAKFGIKYYIFCNDLQKVETIA